MPSKTTTISTFLPSITIARPSILSHPKAHSHIHTVERSKSENIDVKWTYTIFRTPFLRNERIFCFLPHVCWPGRQPKRQDLTRTTENINLHPTASIIKNEIVFNSKWAAVGDELFIKVGGQEGQERWSTTKIKQKSNNTETSPGPRTNNGWVQLMVRVWFIRQGHYNEHYNLSTLAKVAVLFYVGEGCMEIQRINLCGDIFGGLDGF